MDAAEYKHVVLRLILLTRSASAEGKNGGQFYTPTCVVRCLVEMLAPYKGRIYDPACGSVLAIARFVQSEKLVESHGGTATRGSANLNREAAPRDFRRAKDHRGDISIYGQESDATACRLAVMNLAFAEVGVFH